MRLCQRTKRGETHGGGGGHLDRELLPARMAEKLGRERVLTPENELQEVDAQYVAGEGHFRVLWL